jgi:hypothetical protein
MKKVVKVKLILLALIPKVSLIPGNAGRYKSVDRGMNALSRAMKIISPYAPRYFCFIGFTLDTFYLFPILLWL